MIYYKSVKNTINITNIVKVIINIVVRHYVFLELIIGNKDSLFTSKFGLYYTTSLTLNIAFKKDFSKISDRLDNKYKLNWTIKWMIRYKRPMTKDNYKSGLSKSYNLWKNRRDELVEW